MNDGDLDRGVTAEDLEAIGAAIETPRMVTGRPSIADAVARAGLDKLTPQSPVEDVRDALEVLHADTIGPEWTNVDRAAVRMQAERVIRGRGITGARTLIAAILTPDATTASTSSPDGTITLKDDEPATEPVSAAALLDETVGLIQRYVVVPEPAAIAVALWIGAAYAIDALMLMPLLLITAPTMRAGKTTLLTLLGAIVPRALATSNLTGAVLARAIATHRPTLLADEADTWLTDEASELRGIMNAGHTRATAYVLRCAAETHDPQMIPCFGARVIAMINIPTGRLATLLDRSIVVQLRRKRPDERVDRMRLDRLHSELRPLRQQWRRFTNDQLSAIRESDPDVPPLLNDRAADNWRPMLAVADLAKGEWPTRARRAATELTGDTHETEMTVELIADVAEILSEQGGESIASADLLRVLNSLEHRPWPTWRKGRPMTERGLARLLGPLGVHTDRHTFADGRRARGYRSDAFDDSIARYLPSQPSKRPNANVYQGKSLLSQVSADAAKDTCEIYDSANKHKAQDAWTDGSLELDGGDTERERY